MAVEMPWISKTFWGISMGKMLTSDSKMAPLLCSFAATSTMR